MKITESFFVSPTHSWLCGVVVMTPDWESVCCDFKYKIFCFWNEKPSLISLILNTKSEKHECLFAIRQLLTSSSFDNRNKTQDFSPQMFPFRSVMAQW